MGAAPAASVVGGDAPSHDVAAAIAEIAARQQAIETQAVANSPLSLSIDDARSPGRLASLEQMLVQIAAKVETLHKPCGLDDAIGLLRGELASIERAVKEAAPRSAVETLMAQVRALTQRLDIGRQSGGSDTALVGIERELADIRAALGAITPAEHLAAVEAALRTLSAQIDGMLAVNGGRVQADPDALVKLENAAGDLRDIVAGSASGATLAELAAEIRSLAGKLDARLPAAVDNDILKNLDNRLAQIVETIAAERSTTRPASDAADDAMTRVASDAAARARLAGGEREAFSALEGRIDTLIEKLTTSEAQLGPMEAIERRMNELLARSDLVRASGSPAPLSATAADLAPVEDIRRDLEFVRSSQSTAERRSRESLEMVHGALSDVVDRLATIESEVHAGRNVSAASSRPQNAAPTWRDVSNRPGAAPPERPAATDVDAAPAARPPKSVPIDPNLPPDHPLEPGSIARVPARPASDAMADASSAAPQSDIAAANPGATAHTNTSSFIAAARRAAKAAIGEPTTAAMTDAGTFKTNVLPKSGARHWFDGRIKSLLVGVSVVVIVLGTLRLALNFFAVDAESPAEVSQTAPVEPLPRAQAPSIARGTGQDSEQIAPGARILPVAPAPKAPDRSSTLIPEPAPGSNAAPSRLMIPSASPRAPNSLGGAPQPAAAGAERAVDVTGSVMQPQPILRHMPAETAPAATRPAGEEHSDVQALPQALAGAKLRTAAAAGDAAAFYEIGLRFAEGRGTRANHEEAVRWLARAADQGLAPAQFRLGSLYEKGIGVKKSLVEAQRLYLAAANKGNAKAMHNLAVLYAEGLDGKPDYRNAVHWFRKAAAHDVSDSQYNLGVLYARGIGVDHNLPESYKWFTLAAEHGDQDAAKKRDDIGGRLDAQSLMAARLAAQTWTAEPQPDAAAAVKAPAGGWDETSPRAPPNRPKSRPKA
ncbi:MAG: SEL1-like repeat protein [Proteobacteria bacterium]|nr:SEL1-like repeat protein [Pseudomonadota bacterium]